MPKIKFKRGNSVSFQSVTLDVGEPAFLTDTGKLYVGSSGGNININPINKPAAINVNKSFAKNKVNEYGQVIEQSDLVESDIPTISISKVSGTGTSASKNVGTFSGQVPVLDANAKLPISTIPFESGCSLTAYYVGLNTTITAGAIIPVNTSDYSGVYFVVNSDGSITIVNAGRYYVSYNVSSLSADLQTALYPGSGSVVWAGTMARSSALSVPPYTCTSASIVKNFSANEKIAIKNNGLTSAIIVSGNCALSIFKLF